ncbi:1371_t:CDS:2, partial [Rhizophagus irregularis]
MSQKNIITYFLAILVFTVNYGNAIDVQVGGGLYSTFNPSFVSAYYNEPIVFIRTGTKTFILDEYDHCTKSERPDSFHATLTDEQPKATFIPKNTGNFEFIIRTNGPGCEFQNTCTIF